MSKKVVINACFGGFGLSARGLARLAELQGRPCYFFTQDIHAGLRSPYIPATIEQADAAFIFYSFDIPNPNQVLKDDKDFHTLSIAERQARNGEYRSHAVSDDDVERHDANLIRVVEEMGAAANGKHAKLKVVEIPDDVDYVIEEYDGNETIAEAHRTWD